MLEAPDYEVNDKVRSSVQVTENITCGNERMPNVTKPFAMYAELPSFLYRRYEAPSWKEGEFRMLS